LIVCKSFGEIIPEFFLNSPKYGSINVHFSLLPKYRGAVPIQMAILNGDKETGIINNQNELKI
jgi:methionyl-tRNA formyltransferase